MSSLFNPFQPPSEDGSSNTTTNKGGGTQNITHLSPYLNFDPQYIPKLQPEYLYADENHKSHTTKRTSVALPQIGASCIIGAGLGGAAGLYNGLKATTLAGQVGKVRRTQILNYVMKQGSATSCTLGIIASFYSVVGVGVSYARDREDNLNTFIAAATTGALYKSTSGLKRTAMGAAAGLALAGAYTLVTGISERQNVWGNVNQMHL